MNEREQRLCERTTNILGKETIHMKYIDIVDDLVKKVHELQEEKEQLQKELDFFYLISQRR